MSILLYLSLACVQQLTILAVDTEQFGSTGAFFQGDAIGGPSLDAAGNVALSYTVRGSYNGAAIFWYHNGAEELVAGIDDPARRTDFQPDVSSLYQDAFINADDGKVRMIATHAGRMGVWEIDPENATYRSIAVRGEANPLGGTYTGFGGGSTTGGNTVLHASGAGHVVFQAYNDSSYQVWLHDGVSTSLVASTGDAAPGLPGNTFTSFEGIWVSDAGVVSIWAFTDGVLGIQTGVWSTAGGLTPRILTEGEFDGAVAAIGGGMAHNKDGLMAVVGATTVETEPNVFVGRAVVYRLASTATIAIEEGDSVGFRPFLRAEEVAVSSDGRIAVAGVSGDVGSSQAFAAQQLVGGGAFAAATDGEFSLIRNLAVNAQQKVAFVGTLSATGKEGVWSGASGSLVAAVQAGDVVDGYTVQAVGLFNRDHLNRPFSDNGTLCFQIMVDSNFDRGVACTGLETQEVFRIAGPTGSFAGHGGFNPEAEFIHPNWDIGFTFAIDTTANSVPSWRATATFGGHRARPVSAAIDGDNTGCTFQTDADGWATSVTCEEVNVTSAPLSPSNTKAVEVHLASYVGFAAEHETIAAVTVSGEDGADNFVVPATTTIAVKYTGADIGITPLHSADVEPQTGTDWYLSNLGFVDSAGSTFYVRGPAGTPQASLRQVLSAEGGLFNLCTSVNIDGAYALLRCDGPELTAGQSLKFNVADTFDDVTLYLVPVAETQVDFDWSNNVVTVPAAGADDTGPEPEKPDGGCPGPGSPAALMAFMAVLMGRRKSG